MSQIDKIAEKTILKIKEIETERKELEEEEAQNLENE